MPMTAERRREKAAKLRLAAEVDVDARAKLDARRAANSLAQARYRERKRHEPRVDLFDPTRLDPAGLEWTQLQRRNGEETSTVGYARHIPMSRAEARATGRKGVALRLGNYMDLQQLTYFQWMALMAISGRSPAFFDKLLLYGISMVAEDLEDFGHQVCDLGVKALAS